MSHVDIAVENLAWQEANLRHSTFVRGGRCLHCSGWRCGHCLEGSRCQHLQRPASWRESVSLGLHSMVGEGISSLYFASIRSWDLMAYQGLQHASHVLHARHSLCDAAMQSSLCTPETRCCKPPFLRLGSANHLSLLLQASSALGDPPPRRQVLHLWKPPRSG